VSTNGVPIVAERVVGAAAPAEPIGLTIALASPVTATSWLVPVASAPYLSATTVVVTNPSATDAVTVTVSTLGGGAVEPVANGAGVSIAPGARGGFEIPAGANAAELAVKVESDRPVLVEARIAFGAGGLAAPLAVPVEPWVTAATSGIAAVLPGAVVGTVPDAVNVPDGATTTAVGPESTTPPAGANPGG